LNEKTAVENGGILTNSEREISGLFYHMNTGLRLKMGDLSELDMADVKVFVDLDLALFTSPFFVVEKTTSTDGTTGAETESKTEKTHIFAGSEALFSQATVGLGFQF
jgi:hypothetical protein